MAPSASQAAAPGTATWTEATAQSEMTCSEVAGVRYCSQSQVYARTFVDATGLATTEVCVTLVDNRFYPGFFEQQYKSGCSPAAGSQFVIDRKKLSTASLLPTEVTVTDSTGATSVVTAAAEWTGVYPFSTYKNGAKTDFGDCQYIFKGTGAFRHADAILTVDGQSADAEIAYLSVSSERSVTNCPF